MEADGVLLPSAIASGDRQVEPRDLFRRGVELFQAGEYFEAHEVWEELWREASGEVRAFYKGLIQLAVALLHAERGNRSGSERLYHSARRLLEPYRPAYGGYDLEILLRESEPWLQSCWAAGGQPAGWIGGHRPRFPPVADAEGR
jgi:predicted metal-dependent hydrolase